MERLLEVACRGVACVVCHRGYREREVALDKDGAPPPFGPCKVPSGVRSESGRADGVEFGGGGVSGVLEDKCVRLGLKSEGVVVDFGWEERD